MQPTQSGPMTDFHRLVDKIGRTRDCKLLAPSGTPRLRAGDRLPGDLAAFYQLAGGAAFFEHSDYALRVVRPEEFTRANPDIVGCDAPDDISDTWYIVARGSRGQVVTIDCSADRLGRCYDSFWDSHGVAGSCSIVALSFTDLLQRLLDNNGDYWYWLGDGGPAYGDAYGVQLDP
ncbi:MAG: SMI1/KNR4 family protein [Kofleriaceae bacterium]|nr:SMI1/KNR4 family protein [Kofleriaceae bacterium]